MDEAQDPKGIFYAKRHGGDDAHQVIGSERGHSYTFCDAAYLPLLLQQYPHLAPFLRHPNTLFVKHLFLMKAYRGKISSVPQAI